MFDHCFRGVLVSFREANVKSKLNNLILCYVFVVVLPLHIRG